MKDQDGFVDWNFRFVNTPSRNGGDDWIELREVYYRESGVPIGHADPCLGGDNIDEVKTSARRWLQASEMPVLHEKDFHNPES